MTGQEREKSNVFIPLQRRLAFRESCILNRVFRTRQAARFGIEILACSLMENHIHEDSRWGPDLVQTWDDSEVARRWLMICPKRKDDKENALEPPLAELDEIRRIPAEIAKLRTRLSEILMDANSLSEDRNSCQSRIIKKSETP